MIQYQENCRICSGRLVDKLDLGELYPSGFLRPGEKWPDKAPLILAECRDCSLVQLRHTVPLDSMYRQYWYRSGLNASMMRDLEDVIDSVERAIGLVDGNVVLDIGCNDGTLFDFYTTEGLIKVGYDPALNLADQVAKRADHFINDFFTPNYILKNFGPNSVMVITAIAMFYDLPDPNTFLQGIKQILHPSGIFVVQFTDLLSMLQLNAFDNVCHEHLEYYSLKTLNWLMQRHGLEIFDVEYNKVNGGSIRVYIQHDNTDYITLASVQDALAAEAEYFSQWEEPLVSFGERVHEVKELVTAYLQNSVFLGDSNIHALGASTKGNTLLQVFNLNNKLIPYAAEINADKFDLVTVGSNIYILSEDESVHRKPSIYLVLPWHFEKTFTELLHRIDVDQQMQLLFPLPEPRIYHRQESGEYGWTLLKNLQLA